MVNAHNFMRMAKKKAVNLSVDADLLSQAKELDINLSAVLEGALKKGLKEQQEQKWREANKKAIEAYNEFVREHGIFAEGLRSF